MCIRDSRIDADRLTLTLTLLDKVAFTIPACTGEIHASVDYHHIQHALSLLSMALAELHRLQDQANEAQP